MLHSLGAIEEVYYEINNGISTEVATKNSDLCCHIDDLMFIQPGINSLMDQ